MRKMNKLLAMLLALVLVLQMVPVFGVAAAADPAEAYVRPTTAVYSFPAQIQANMVSNVDYTTNEGVYVFTGNGYMYGRPHEAVFDHINKNILLMQTVKVDALPEQTYVSAADQSKGGLTIAMIDRVNGAGANCQTVALTIVNEGGKLVAYLNADNRIALGKGLGEEFELLIRWNADDSAAIFVDGKCAGTAKGITAVCHYNGNDQVGYIYAGEAANITVTDVAVYEDPIPAVVEAFNALIAAMDLSAVFGSANLPTEVAGAAITWTSSNPAVLANDGKVVAMPAADTAVTLTASCAGQTANVVAVVKANDYIAPSSVLYAFPQHINAGASSNVDYTTNEGVYVIDSAAIADDQTVAQLNGKAHTANIDHIARNLLLKQTIKIDAMPELAYASVAEASTGGFTAYIIDRVNGQGADCQTVALTIVNEGGKLFGYFNANAKFDLGVELGDEFELLINWNTDNSAAVYVDGVCVGKAAGATIVRGWNGSDQIGYAYRNLADGDVKITWTDAAVYEDPAAAIVEAFDALIASLDLSEIYGAAQLPTQVSGAAISWISSNPAVLANDGKVVAMPAVDTQVTLTASCAGKTANVFAVVKANDYVAPSSVLYAFPQHINTGASSNVDYTTNEGVYVIDSAVIADDQTEAILNGKAHTGNIDHIARNLLLKQTIKIEAMPELTYASAAEGSTGGFTAYIIDRVDGNGADCQTVALTIVNEGGKLYGYLNADAKFNLGVELGDEFELLINWNTDNSAAVYVDGVCVGKAAGATIVRSYNGNDQIGYAYRNLADGDVKITWTDAAVYEDPAAALAEDFVALMDSLNLNAVFGNANLPTKVGAATISWKSSNPAVLADNGKVVAMPEKDTQVTLTATCAGVTKTIVATVKANDYVAPTSVLYSFPAQINAGASSNVDYTTNTGVYVIDSAAIADDQTVALLNGKAHTANIDHIARNLLLKQTIKIDAMPELAYASAAEGSTGGFTAYIIDRVGGQGADCQTVALTIVNEGGKLYGYLNADAKFNLGVELGDEFELLINWNTDNSAAVYVDGMCVGKAANATIVRGWNGSDQIGYAYRNLADGDVKITWTDAAVYEDPAAALAEDFVALMDSLNLNAVFGNANLPAKVGTATITWKSSNPAVLSDDGKVVAMPDVDTQVTLTATCAGVTKTIVATVKANDYLASSHVLYTFPQHINAGASSNVDYLTNEGVYVINSAALGTDQTEAMLNGKAHTANIDHVARNLMLEQTITIDAMPELAYTNVAENSTGGFVAYMIDRVNGVGTDCQTVAATIVNKGGKLHLYFNDSACFDMGKALGDTFKLSILWNTDNSATAYVDGVAVGAVDNATIVRGYNGNDQIGYAYRSLGNGNVKITWTDVAVYEAISSELKEALTSVTTAQIVESVYADKITGGLPTSYTIGDMTFDVAWTVVDGSVNADGSIIKGSEDKSVTLSAIIAGLKAAPCVKVIAAKEKIAINPTSGVVNRLELNQCDRDSSVWDTVNNNVISGDVAVKGNEFTFQGVGTVGSKTNVGVFDHAAYDILIQQNVAVKELPECEELFTLNNKVYTLNGYRFLVSDRLEAGAEITVDAAIQNIGGKLVLVVANGAQNNNQAVTVELGKILGDEFVLSLLWAKSGSLTVYVDGTEIASLADGTRDSAWSGSDCTTLYCYADKASVIVSNYRIYNLGVVAMVGETEFNDVQAAIDAAAKESYKVVTLINNAVTGDVQIPAGVILDLAGYALYADNLVSFGHVVSNGSANGRLYVTDRIELDANNAQMALYHNSNECYMFFDATANALGTKGTNKAITFGFAPQFTNAYAYHLIGRDAPEGSDANSGMKVIVSLNWTGNEGDALTYVFSDELVKEYGNTAHEFDGKLTAAMLLKVTGAETLDYGSEVFVDVIAKSNTGVEMVFETISFVIEP